MRQALVMPKVGESVTEGTVLSWLKAEGDRVVVDENLLEVETEKVNVEIPSPWNGVLHIAAQEGEKVKVGEPLAYVETEEGASAPGPAPPPDPREARLRVASVSKAPAAIEQREPDREGGRFSPAVLGLAREHKVDLSQVVGSGLMGRITRKDVLDYVESGAGHHAPAPPPPPAVAPLAAPPAAGELLPLTPMRQTIARNLVRSAQTIPHAWLMVEADVTALVRWRQEVKEEFRQREDVELTYLPFAINAAVEALKEHPLLNSSWSDEGIVLKKEINLGIAVATEQGLIVPVVHNADALSIAGLAKRAAELTELARTRKLKIEQIERGSFTIDNTGAIGSVMSMPLVNHPQAAIMTLEAIVPRAVVVNDAIAIRHMVNLCLSFDHRILDGAEAGAFLNAVKAKLERFGPGTGLY